jgi:hypothetical protein
MKYLVVVPTIAKEKILNVIYRDGTLGMDKVDIESLGFQAL